jgi:hypothetical protein
MMRRAISPKNTQQATQKSELPLGRLSSLISMLSLMLKVMMRLQKKSRIRVNHKNENKQLF